MCYVKNVNHPVPFDDDTYQQNDGVIKVVMAEMIGDDNRKGHAFFCYMLSLLTLFVLFVAAKTTHTVHWDWSAVFSPIFLFLGTLCFLPRILRMFPK